MPDKKLYKDLYFLYRKVPAVSATLLAPDFGRSPSEQPSLVSSSQFLADPWPLTARSSSTAVCSSCRKTS